MLQRSSEMGEELPIVSICVIADKNKCPTAFIPVLKAFDDQSDADLWKDGGFFGFNRSVRYIALSRAIADASRLEVVTDLLVINEKEAIPANFISIDFTVDSNERALRKKYLCARYSPRNDTLDAVVDVIVIARAKRPPKGYTEAGEIDGVKLCFKIGTIPDSYGRMATSQSNPTLYPPVPKVPNEDYRHSTSDLERAVHDMHTGYNNFTIKSTMGKIKGIDGIPFRLRPSLESSSKRMRMEPLTELIDPQVDMFEYSFATERQCAA